MMADSQLKSPTDGRPKFARQGRLEICPKQELLDLEARDTVPDVPIVRQRLALSESIQEDDMDNLNAIRRTVSDTTHVRSRKDVHLRVR